MSEINLLFNNLNFNWSAIEIIAVLFSIIYVILASKQNIWCWIFSIISTILYVYIFFTAKLFAESMLYVFYLFMSAYGYYNWNKNEGQLTVNQLSIKKNLSFIFIGTVIHINLSHYYLLSFKTSSIKP